MDSTKPEVGSNPSANTFEDENEAVDTNDPSSRKHSKKEWEDQRSRIADLYESGTLQNLTNVMKEDYQFEATPKQFKDRIKKWGLKKNIQPDEMEAMIRKQQQRLQEENKQTAFELRGRPVNQEKIDRYKRDHPIKDHVEIYKTMGGAVTPPDISYHTPADTGSVLEEPLGSEPVSMPVPNPAGGTDMSNSQQSQTNPYTSMGSGQSFTQVNPSTAQQTYNLFGHIQPPPSQYMYSFSGSSSIPNQPFSAGSHVPPHNTPTPLASPPQAPQSFGQGAPQGYAFQYSTCTGRRKALLIGINYFGQRGQLRGCINDVKNMSSFLHENFGYPRDNMVILTDDQQDLRSQPTKQNILRAMHWLVKDARLNDSLFFHFSGHGGQIKDLDGDEDDGYDEVVYPVDFRQVGHITDDEMHRIMVATLPQGVRLTALFDSCHSGTALDLPYIYSTQGILREPNLAKEAGQGLLGVIASYSKMDIASSKKKEEKNRKDRKGDKDNKPGKNGEDNQGIASRLIGFFKKATEGDETTKKTAPIQTKTSGADVVMWSCTVAQSSAEISQAETGAMSWAFITAMRKNPQQSYLQLLNSARDELASKYSMVPQLSCSHPLNTNLLFAM